MANMALPDAEYLNKRLAYDRSTGLLLWKANEEGDERWNRKHAGKPAMNCIGRRGYRVGRIGGVACRAHRIIWKMVTGTEPAEIDHINGDPADNRWVNLRGTTRKLNMRNTRLPKHNKSGVMGVSWMASKGKWRATIAGRHLGVFDSIAEAAIVRKEAEEALGYHPNHGSIR